MDERQINNNYESLYSQLYDRAEQLHESNKRRIRRGMIGLIVLPVVLGAIRAMTGSDRVVFLIIWVISMFILCAYLITVEYLDDSIKKTLEDMTSQEAEFDELFVHPERIQGRLRERINEIRTGRLSLPEGNAGAEEPAPVTEPEPEPSSEEGGAR
ncbi:MAG: hypothetical protein IJI11_04960 [Mogibacterium sp.]|nr:hypothetical protein [Mogibacterium sp.]